MERVKSFCIYFVMFFCAFYLPDRLLAEYHVMIRFAVSVVLFIILEVIKNAVVRYLRKRKQNI